MLHEIPLEFKFILNSDLSVHGFIDIRVKKVQISKKKVIYPNATLMCSS